MSQENNTPSSIGSGAVIKTARSAPSAGTEQLLHELANLLDASTRNIQLVIRRMDGSSQPDQVAVVADDALLSRLRVAHGGMTQMATLLQRWMRHANSTAVLFDQDKSVAETVEQVVQLLTPNASARGIEIAVSIADDVAAIPAGPIFPVIFNALCNSIEAVSAERPIDGGKGAPVGHVAVSGRLEDSHVRLTVVDDGPGLDRSVLSKDGLIVFGQTTKAGGHGVGLALCRQIVGLLGGMVRVENRTGGGAVFSAIFPVPPRSR